MSNADAVGRLIFKQNLHTHSTWCDGRATPREMVERAIELGLDSIGFSSHTHMDYSDFLPRVTHESTEAYKREIRALKEEYRGRIEIYLGLELDVFSDGDVSGLDYLIGGVHSIRGRDGRLVDFDGREAHFRQVIDECCGGDGMELARRYYEAVAELPTLAKCDIIAHFDLVTKHSEKVCFFDEESEEYRYMALNAVHAIAGRIPYFEVNVGAIARGYKSVPYPAPFLAREMLECGMGAVIGTDCHHPEFLFENVDLGIELLRSVGAREVFVLREGGFEPIKI